MLMSEYDGPSINDLNDISLVEANLVEQRNDVKMCWCLSVKEVEEVCV